MVLPVTIKTSQTIVVDTELYLPDGRSWAHVKNWNVKWGTLHVTWEDDTTWETELNDLSPETLAEAKTPDSTQVWQADMMIDNDEREEG